MQEYQEELVVAKFLSTLRLELASQVHGHILGSDIVPSLTTAFSRVLHIATGTPTVHSYQSALATYRRGHDSGRSRDRSRGRDSKGGRSAQREI